MERKGMGILGSVLGAMLGSLPMVIVGLLGFFTGWLGIFTAIGAFKGYEKFNGTKSIQFAKTTIIGSTIIVTAVLSIIFGSQYIAGGMVFGNPAIFVIIPIFAGYIGYAFVNKKVQLYVNPNIMQDALEKAREENAKNPDYGLYLPQMELLKTRELGINVLMFLPFVLIALLSTSIYLYNDETYLIAFLSAIIGWLISVIVLAVSMGSLRFHAYAKTSDNRIYKINLQKLNTDPRYHFHLASTLTGFNVKKITEGELEVLRASVYRAIRDLYNQQDSGNKSLPKLSIVELRDLQLIKNSKNTYKISYIKPNGRIKKDQIAKIYENFAPFSHLPSESRKLSVDVKAIMTPFICTIIAFIAIFTLSNIMMG